MNHLHVHQTRCLEPPNSLVIVLLLVGMAVLNDWTASRNFAADFLVTNNNDAGTGSLREALLNANNLPGSHEINLSAIRGTIALSSPLPPIYQSMTISGPGSSDLTISGRDQHRVFFALQGDITIKDLSIADGHARGGSTSAGGGAGMGAGGALFVNQGTNVTIENVVLLNNRATGGSALWSVRSPFGSQGASGGGGGLGGNGGVGFFNGGGGGGLYGNGGAETLTPGVITFTMGGGGGGGGLAADGGRGNANGGGGGGITGNGGDARTSPPTGGQPSGGGGAGTSQGPRLAGDGTAGSGGIATTFIGTFENTFVNTVASAGGGGGGIGGENGEDGQIAGLPASGGDGGDGGFGGGGGGGGSVFRFGGGSQKGSGGSGGDGGVGGGGGGSGVTGQFFSNSFGTTKGGNGGDFGGGGGSADRYANPSGGNGGFGGGGGANLHITGGNGGFGGGGGWGRVTAGNGGTYGGAAASGFLDQGGGPGGGAALGGTVFVRQGGTLTLKNVSMSGGNVLGGIGANNGQDGQAFADGIFLHGSTINIDAADNQVLIISNDIGDGTSASPAGAVNKIGPGTLILSGTNQFRGNTTVMDGQLVVNGVLSSPSIVQSNGLLSGSGTLGNTTVEGRIRPGNSIGTLHVNGNYTQAASSHYEVELDSAGNSDRIAVTGDAILNGGTVDVVAAPGNYTPGQTYSILTTTGTVSGQYSAVTDNLFLFEPQLHYTTHEVQLLIQFDSGSFDGIPATPNQQSVASHFLAIYQNTTGDLRAALDQLNFLPSDQVQSVLQQLSGEAIGSLTSVSFQNSSLFLRQVTDRLRPLGGGIPGGDQVASAWSNRRDSSSRLASLDLDTIVRAQDGGIEYFGWVNGFGTGGQVQGDGNAAGLNYDIAGSSVGVDRFIDCNTIVGFAGGYSGLTQIGVDGTNANINALHAVLYGSSVWDSWYGIGSLGYGNYDYRTLRQITAGGAASVARADFDGNEFSSYFELGTSLSGQRLTLQPFFGAQYVLLQRNSATEIGASPFNLSLASSTDDSSRGFLGARVIGVNTWRDKTVSGEIHGRWMHEFLSDTRLVNARIAALPTAPGFTAIGNSLGKEFGSVGVTCSLLARNDLNVFVGYDLDFAQRLVAHTGFGGMQFAW